ncbi:OXA-48 family carbapenem-hydrolyzing class D beta-lactamase OXA-54 [soil metagenome]
MSFTNLFTYRFTFISLSLFAIFSSCSVNKAKIDNSLKTYFDQEKVDGCFSMFNNATGAVTVYNITLDTQRFTPASTFKIVNSLIGIETGRISDENMVIKWDGVKRRAAWDKDLTMTEAFRESAVPYYQEVARKVGKDTMQQWIDSLKYGNMQITGPVDSFWLNNSLKISPDEQLGLVKKLYFDKLPFQKRSQQVVRDAMLQENTTQYQLAYKTGWGYDEKNNSIGWVVGWVEENKHPYFFVTFIRTPDPNIDIAVARIRITKNILSHLKFFKGEK